MNVRVALMSWHKELVELLPTKWSRWTAGSSILLSVVAYNLPSLLPESVLAIQPLTLFLVKLLLSISTLLLGSLVTLALVVRAYNALKNEQNQTISGAVWADHEHEMESSKTPWNI